MHSIENGAEAVNPAASLSLLSDLGPHSLWVSWRSEARSPGEKPTKVPYGIDGLRASSTRTTRWEPLANVMRAEAANPAVKLGIMFAGLHDGTSLCGFDLDSCIRPDGSTESWASRIIDTLGSYSEISPSGTGVKILFRVHADEYRDLHDLVGGYGTKWLQAGEHEAGQDHPPAVELFIGRRFFAVTGQALASGAVQGIRLIGLDALSELITSLGPRAKRAEIDSAVAVWDSEPIDDDELAEKLERAREGDTRLDAYMRGEFGNSQVDRSARAFALGASLKGNGFAFGEMVRVLETCTHTAAWTREKGHPNDCRELHRIWERASAKEPRPPAEMEFEAEAAPNPQRSNRPKIGVRVGRIDKIADEVERILVDSDLPIYRRGDSLVRPCMQKVPASNGRTTTSGSLKRIELHALIDLMSQAADFQMYDAAAKEWKDLNPPENVAKILLSRAGFWQFPLIAGVITTPTLRPDGSLISDSGFDARTRIYHLRDHGLVLPSIPKAPTRDDAEKALVLLLDLISGFPFASEADRTVALSALVTPIVRGALMVAPLHAFTAPDAGTGKSYLMDTVSAIAVGQPCPVVPADNRPEETDKRLGGMLLRGCQIISLDNLSAPLGGDFLCQAVDRPLVEIRPLGTSDISTIENRHCLFATGNNLVIKSDATRRAVLCTMDARVERPELREFDFQPVNLVLADRGTYIAACLTITRAYMHAGLPGKLKPLASFEDWSDRVRSALVWLGCADPLSTMETVRDGDPVRAAMAAVLTAWHSAFGNRPTTARDAVEACAFITEEGDRAETLRCVRDALMAVAAERGSVDPVKLGYWLRKHKEKIVGGLRLEKAGTDRNSVATWKVERLE